MSEEKSTQKISYIVTALIHTVKIQTKNPIDSKVRWKRRQNKVETKVVKSDKQFLRFQESISLPFTFVYDKQIQKYIDKNTEIYCIVIQDGGLKHGGEAKYNISEVLNENLENKPIKIDMINSPDKSAYIYISFSFQKKSPIDSANSLGVSNATDENTSIFLQQNSSIHQDYGKSKQNINFIHNRSFLKDKTNTNNKPANSKTKPELNQAQISSILQEQNQQLKQKIKLLQDTIKSASLQIKSRDRQIVELKQTIIPQIQSQLVQERQNTKFLKGRIMEFEEKQTENEKLRASRFEFADMIDDLKSKLADSKLCIGSIMNTADDIGGSILVSQLFASIGVEEANAK